MQRNYFPWLELIFYSNYTCEMLLKRFIAYIFFLGVALQLHATGRLEKAREFLLHENEPIPEQKEEERGSLSGTWYGARQKLEDHGIDFNSSYVVDFNGNPVGGLHRGFANAASFECDLTFDFEKFAKAKGLNFFVSFVFRSGNNLSAEKIDNQFNVAQEFGGETYKLNEAYFRERLFDDRFTLKAGRLNAGNDFLSSPLYCQYVSNAFCGNPNTINFNVPFTPYPFATWGAYTDFKPVEPLLIKFGVYNNNPNIQENKYHGVNFTFHNTVGISLFTEWVYLNNQKKGTHGLPGNYKVGYYYITGKVARFEGGFQRGNYGYYFLADQSVYKKSEQEIITFASFLFAPENRNLFPFFLEVGATYKGLVPSRKEDSISLGIAYGLYSSDMRHVQRQARSTHTIGAYGNRPQTFETVLEADYWLQLNKWFALTPDIQYVINPKGYGSIPNALVFGLEISVVL